MGKHVPTPESIKPRKVSRRQRMAIDDAKSALRGELRLPGQHPLDTALASLRLCVMKDERDGLPPMEYKTTLDW